MEREKRLKPNRGRVRVAHSSHHANLVGKNEVPCWEPSTIVPVVKVGLPQLQNLRRGRCLRRRSHQAPQYLLAWTDGVSPHGPLQGTRTCQDPEAFEKKTGSFALATGILEIKSRRLALACVCPTILRRLARKERASFNLKLQLRPSDRLLGV